MDRRPAGETEEEAALEADPATSHDTTTAQPSETTVELLRWAWGRLLASPELVAPFVFVAVAVTSAEAGITTVRAEVGTVPRFALWVWPVYLGSFLVGCVGLGAIFLAAADARVGLERPHGPRLRVAARRLPSMLGAGVVGGIPIVAGLFAFLIPGIYFLLKFALALPACVIDDLAPADGLRRSFVTTGEHLYPIAGLLASFIAAMLLTSVVVTLLRATVRNGFVGPLVQNLTTAILVTLYGLALGRLYPTNGDSLG